MSKTDDKNLDKATGGKTYGFGSKEPADCPKKRDNSFCKNCLNFIPGMPANATHCQKGYF